MLCRHLCNLPFDLYTKQVFHKVKRTRKHDTRNGSSICYKILPCRIDVPRRLPSRPEQVPTWASSHHRKKPLPSFPSQTVGASHQLISLYLVSVDILDVCTTYSCLTESVVRDSSPLPPFWKLLIHCLLRWREGVLSHPLSKGKNLLSYGLLPLD